MLPKFAITHYARIQQLAVLITLASILEALILGKETFRLRISIAGIGAIWGLIQYHFMVWLLKPRDNLIVPPWFHRIFGRMVFFSAIFVLIYLPIAVPFAPEPFPIEGLSPVTLSGLAWLLAALKANMQSLVPDESA
jgi:hypothetical protein